MKDHVIVTFGAGPAEGWCQLSHEPMHVHGPYGRDEAREVIKRLPLWMQPHILSFSSDDDACLREPS